LCGAPAWVSFTGVQLQGGSLSQPDLEVGTQEKRFGGGPPDEGKQALQQDHLEKQKLSHTLGEVGLGRDSVNQQRWG